MTALRRFLKDESGTATIEFLFVFPIVFMIFTAGFESSMYMARYVMMDRGVDIVVRQLRLGTLGNISHQTLKRVICRQGMMIDSMNSCLDRMRIWMQPITDANLNINVPRGTCVDRADQLNIGEPPANEYTMGVSNEIMLMRVCFKEWPMFPTTAISVQMPRQSDGSVAMFVTTVFVNEPR
ncbi:MAG: pilus assembly protein [Tabrizicola sp.]|jgi:Flp pilus assembly protein TadG|nr:pilus assembly protein [Tabrizicola sp.]